MPEGAERSAPSFLPGAALRAISEQHGGSRKERRDLFVGDGVLDVPAAADP